MSIRFLLALLAFALVACDDDSTGPGGGRPGPSVADRALDLRNFYEDEPFVVPASTSTFATVHQTGIVTIEAWVELFSLGSTFMTICSNKSDETEAGFYFGIEARDGLDNARLRLNVTDENGNTVVDAQGTPGSVHFSPWQRFAVIADGSQVRFVLGDAEEIVTPTFANLGSIAPAARDLTVGSTRTDVSNTFQLNALVDELRIWSVARTPVELLATGGGPLPAEVYARTGSGLLGYWPFDTFENLTAPSDGPDDLRDRSGRGVHLDAPNEARLAVSAAFDETD